MPEELTGPQSTQIGGALFGGTGMAGLGGYGHVYKTQAGQTILPPAAALHGSGAFTGDNAYDAVGIGHGLAQAPYLWPGNFHTYRRMRAHPTLAVVRSLVICPMIAAGWSREVVHKGRVPKRAVQLVEEAILPQRVALMLLFTRAFDYGFQAAEVVWGANAAGWTVPAKVKGLLPDFTTFRTDPKGNVLAVVNGGVDVSIDRAALYSYDAEGGDPFGRGRNENARRAWSNYLNTEDKLNRLVAKTSGTQGGVGYPSDNGPKRPGRQTSAERAATMARAMMNGQWYTYPVYGSLEVDDVKDAVELSKGNPLYPITLHDMGNTGPAQAAALDQLRYYDQLLCRSWLRSERSVIEAQGGGTRAESADHTANIGDTDTDLCHEEIVGVINRQLVDPMLVENFGERARGAVRVRANEIVDENQVIERKILDAWLKDGLAFGELLNRMDLDGFCERQGIRLREGAEGWPEEMPSGEGGGDAGEPHGDDDEGDDDPKSRDAA